MLKRSKNSPAPAVVRLERHGHPLFVDPRVDSVLKTLTTAGHVLANDSDRGCRIVSKVHTLCPGSEYPPL